MRNLASSLQKVLASERRRVLWSLAVYSCVIVAFYRGTVLDQPLLKLTSALAHLSAESLRWLGFTAIADGNIILLASGGMYELSYRCTGILPISCLVVCLLASKGPAGWKVMGILLGTGFLSLLNEVRILHLISINEGKPELFDFMHDVLWGSLPVLAVPLLFVGWRRWVWKHG